MERYDELTFDILDFFREGATTVMLTQRFTDEDREELAKRVGAYRMIGWLTAVRGRTQDKVYVLTELGAEFLQKERG